MSTKTLLKNVIVSLVMALTLTAAAVSGRVLEEEPVSPGVEPETPASVATPVSGVAFAKPNGAVLAVNNGVDVNNANSGIISNNNIPFLTGLSGITGNAIQNNGNNNNIIGGGFGFPALNMAQLGSGITFQKLMFGTMTVFDDELTEGHELNSGLVGKAQGFYIASSEDGTSQTMAFTVMFHSGSYSDSLTFFGVHRIRVSESHLAIMGGTGKYVNAKGFATVKTIPAAPNQQETDGVQTVLHITVYLAY
nr:dirigent protein 25-like isoform X2 [Ipomoea batatas]